MNSNKLIVYILAILLTGQTFYMFNSYSKIKFESTNEFTKDINNKSYSAYIKISDTQSFICQLNPITKFQTSIIYNLTVTPNGMHPNNINVEIISKYNESIINKYNISPTINKEYIKKIIVPIIPNEENQILVKLYMTANNKNYDIPIILSFLPKI